MTLRLPALRRALCLGATLLLMSGLAACEKKEEGDKATAGSTAPVETPPGDEPTGDAGTPEEVSPDETPTDGAAPGAPVPQVDGPHAVRTIAPADLAGDGSCIGEKSPMCDDAPEPAPCEAGADANAVPINEVYDDPAAWSGKQVTVRGTLVPPPIGGCTEMACDRQCCNGCTGAMMVQATKGLPVRKFMAFVLDGGPDQPLMCGGDESGLCCKTRPPAGDVLVTGTAERIDDKAIGLRSPTVCTL